MKREPTRRTRKGSKEPERLPSLGSGQNKQTNRRRVGPQKQRQMDYAPTRNTHHAGCRPLWNRKTTYARLDRHRHIQIVFATGLDLSKVASLPSPLKILFSNQTFSGLIALLKLIDHLFKRQLTISVPQKLVKKLVPQKFILSRRNTQLSPSSSSNLAKSPGERCLTSNWSKG